MDNETKVITPLRKMHQCLIHSNLCLCQKTSQKTKPCQRRKKFCLILKERTEKWWLILLAILAVLGIGTAVFFASGGRGEVVVPDVSDLSEASARETLAKAKLEVATKTEEIADDKIEEGNVVKTDPAAERQSSKTRSHSVY